MADRPDPLVALSFEVARQELLDRANTLRAAAGLPPFLDDVALNPHVLMLELLAAYIELTGAVIDNRRLAALLVTSRTLRDAVVAARQIDYDWIGVGPAVVKLEIDFGVGGHSKNITIPDGFKWHSNPDYHQDGQAFIPAGTQFVNVTARQVEKRTHTVFANGSANQEFELPESPVVKGTFSATVNGAAARLVEYLFELDASELGLQARVNENEVAVFLTGDGTDGLLLTVGDTIVVNYETSRGVNGRIPAGTITAPVDTILDEDSTPVTPTAVTQAEASTGGSAMETLDEMRINGPRSLRTLDANINKSDFETHAQQVAGVQRAIALTWQDDATIGLTTVLVLAAAEAVGSEETLFSDTHVDPVIDPGVWETLEGSWIQSGGELIGQTAASKLRLVGLTDFWLPVEARLEMRAVDTDPVEIVFLNPATGDELFVEITPDGAGDANVLIGQRISGTPTTTAGTLGVDPLVTDSITLKYTLADGLQLLVDGTPVVTFASPDAAFRVPLELHLRGKLASTQTQVVQLVAIGIPNAALLEAMRVQLTDKKKLFVTTKIVTGSVRFRVLSLIAEVTPLAGWTQAQAEANAEQAMRDLLAILRRDENDEFVNIPGQSVFTSQLIAAGQGAEGVKSFRILWPDCSTVFEIVPAATEFIVLGEVLWQAP